MSVAGAGIACLVGGACVWIWLSSKSKHLPPGPSRIPLLGNIHQIPLKQPWLEFTSWKSQFGDVVYLSVLGQPIVILNSLKAVKDLLDQRSSIYSDRPIFTMVGELMGLDQSFPLMDYGPSWRHSRKLANVALNSDAVVKYHQVQEQHTAIFLDSIIREPSKFIENLRLTAGRIVMSVTYGLPVDTPDSLYITHAEETMVMISKSTMVGAHLVDAIPILKYIPSAIPFSPASIARPGRHEIESLVTRPFLHVQNDMNTGKASSSFTSQLLTDNLDTPPETQKQGEEAIKWIAGSLYGAGGESTYATILAFILAMAQNPEIQRRGQQEVDQHLSSGDLPRVVDALDMPYVVALAKETMRWRPALPLSIPRRARQDDVYEGMHIPKGALIIPNVWAISREECGSFPPEDFAPERYLADAPVDSPMIYALGFGRRICPGKLLGWNNVVLLVASLLAAFDISPVEDDDDEYDLSKVEFTTGLVSCAMPYNVTIRPRSSHRKDVIQHMASQLRSN